MDFKPDDPFEPVPREKWDPRAVAWRPVPRSQRFDVGPRALLIFTGLFLATVYTTWAVGGPGFSLSLLLILGTHEFGHYLACRLNDVDASLPNFIPAPPFFMVGTFGAFIRIKEPIPNRRALMEIGASGPLAGFLMAIPVLIIGLARSQVIPAAPMQGFNLGDSLVTLFFSKWVLGVTSLDEQVTILVDPVAYAGWFGMFITAMNLLPISQLDGGHVMYALFPEHSVWTARLFFALLMVMGLYWPGWYVLGFFILMIGLRHPPPLEVEETLPPLHRIMGYACIVVFLCTFIPIPIEWVGA